MNFCAALICIHALTSTVPGKTDWFIQAPDQTLIIQWLDPTHTLNIEDTSGTLTEWIYDGDQITNL